MQHNARLLNGVKLQVLVDYSIRQKQSYMQPLNEGGCTADALVIAEENRTELVAILYLTATCTYDVFIWFSWSMPPLGRLIF